MTGVNTGFVTSLPCGLETLVPHQFPILMDGHLTKAGDLEDSRSDSTVAAAAPFHGLFVHEGKILPEYLVELMAQSTAALQGYSSLVQDKPGGAGLLVAIDRFTWKNNPIPGEQLQVTFHKVLSFDSVHIFEGDITGSHKQLGGGRLKIWTDSDNKERDTTIRQTENSPSISIMEALQETHSHDATGTFTFTETFPGFQGHFPGNPILPAVVQTAAVQLLAEQQLDTQLTAVSATNIKFEKKITPEESVVVCIQVEQIDSEVNVVFSITGVSGRISSGEIMYTQKK